MSSQEQSEWVKVVHMTKYSLCTLCSGAIQSFAGFTDYFSAMAQEGWYPLMCVGLRAHWEDVHLQDMQDSYGQEWVSMGAHTHI